MDDEILREMGEDATQVLVERKEVEEEYVRTQKKDALYGIDYKGFSNEGLPVLEKSINEHGEGSIAGEEILDKDAALDQPLGEEEKERILQSQRRSNKRDAEISKKSEPE